MLYAPLSHAGSAYGPACPDEGNQALLTSAMDFARTCFARMLGRELDDSEIETLQLDIDMDSKAELFIGRRGFNAGSLHYSFRKTADGYRYLGAISLHPKAVRVMPPDADGLPKLLLYRHQGAGSGLLVHVKYKQVRYVKESSEMIYPGSDEADKQRYIRLFGIPLQE